MLNKKPSVVGGGGEYGYFLELHNGYLQYVFKKCSNLCFFKFAVILLITRQFGTIVSTSLRYPWALLQQLFQLYSV